VRNSQDIIYARREMHKLGANIPLIAKIEKHEALNELHEIIHSADGIMVARGDLGIEVALEEVPIVQKEGETPHLSATVVQSADRLRVSEIQTHISDAVKRPFSQTRIGPLLIDRKNSFLNRTLLKLLHFTIYNFPKFYVSKGGGGISVSSLLNHNDADFDFRPVAFGPTAYTFCMTTVKKTPEGRSVLKIGVGWDHRCGGGNEMAEGIKGLSRIMAANDPQTLEQFL
ncbi:MAG: pyruvate kinase, partial [Bdellovibrionia bacterium]